WPSAMLLSEPRTVAEKTPAPSGPRCARVEVICSTRALALAPIIPAIPHMASDPPNDDVARALASSAGIRAGGCRGPRHQAAARVPLRHAEACATSVQNLAAGRQHALLPSRHGRGRWRLRLRRPEPPLPRPRRI